jgi:hypothetical protein
MSMTRKRTTRAVSIQWVIVLASLAIVSTWAAVTFTNQARRQAPELSVRSAAATGAGAVASGDARGQGRNLGNQNLVRKKKFVPRGLWREDDPNLADIKSLKFNLLTVNPNKPDLNEGGL